MKFKWLTPLLLLLLVPMAAAAQELPFLPAGISLRAPSEWAVLSSATLDGQRSLLDRLGADPEAMAADYAANHIIFEVFFPEGGQVSLAMMETEQTLAFQSMERMQPAQAKALYARYDREPYAHLAYTEDPPGYLSCDWTRRVGDVDVAFACLVFVKQGALYTLTATGTLPVEALHAANRAVLDAMTLLGVRVPDAGFSTSIQDDGKITPVSLVDFTGVSMADTTELFIRTLPGAELVLRTATDTLRAVADEKGQHSFRLSTRREAVYAYTLSAAAPGRDPGEMKVTIVRRLSGEAQLAAYRNAARWMESDEYRRVAASPGLYTGAAYALRGRASALEVVNGFPIVLVHTRNPAKGMWRDPLWVLLTEPMEIAVGEMLNIYGEIRGDTLPYTEESGVRAEAPVLLNWIVTK